MIVSDRPQFSEIDAWGLTHTGRVRQENQGHFFVGALARGITVEVMLSVPPSSSAFWIVIGRTLPSVSHQRREAEAAEGREIRL